MSERVLEGLERFEGLGFELSVLLLGEIGAVLLQLAELVEQAEWREEYRLVCCCRLALSCCVLLLIRYY